MTNTMAKIKTDLVEYDRLLAERVRLHHEKTISEFTDRYGEIKNRLDQTHEQLLNIGEQFQIAGLLLNEYETLYRGN
jgi:hypothetical protein